LRCAHELLGNGARPSAGPGRKSRSGLCQFGRRLAGGIRRRHRDPAAVYFSFVLLVPVFSLCWRQQVQRAGWGLRVQIDWLFSDAVNWAEVAWFSGIAFLATLVGNIVIFKHWFGATVLAGALFAAGYGFLVYYPHERPVPGLSRAPTKFGHAITAQIPEAAPERVSEDADQWRNTLLQPNTVCSVIRCLGFSAARAASSDR
jgi:hypothetical protein